MVFVAPFIGAAALLSSFAAGVPMRRDSAIGEAAVSAPDGTPITETSVAQQTSSAATVASSPVVTSSSSGGYGSSSSSSSGSSGSWGSSGGCSSGDCGSGSGNSWDTTSITLATSTQAAWGSYQSPSYGSGSSSWGSSGSSGYNDCVQQCVANFGSPMQSYQPPPPTTTTDQSGSSGATHTVIVAPSMGVLRYVPFAVNASVGDTIKFMWGANNHTVTKSNTLELCNKSSDPFFTSGTHDKDFVFTQVVNDTNPTFFHCGTPGHCQKGMFGIINPPTAFASPSSADVMMQSLMANDSSLAAASAYSDSMTANNAAATNWGGSILMSGMPDWAHSVAAENILYTRNFLAANPDVLKKDGTVDLSTAQNTPLMIPQDINAAINNGANAGSTTSTSSTTVNTPASTSSSSATESSAVSQNSTNGASTLASSKVLVGLVAAIASLVLL